MNLAAWALAAMLSLSPLDRHRPPPGWEETIEARRARYVSIAEDIGAIAHNRHEAAALVGVAFHESGFAADVDAGKCAQLGAFKGRCDGGRAASIFQLQDGDGARLELFKSNRREAAREAMRRIRVSYHHCAKNEETERLALYAGGTCSGAAAREAARGLHAAIRKALRVPAPATPTGS